LLLDVPRPQALAEGPVRASWAPEAAPDSTASGAIGCFGILVGALLGSAMVFGLPGAKQPVAAGAAGTTCGLSVIPDMAGRLILGAISGAAAGGLTAAIVLIRLGPGRL
jgi:hypothetical protein